MKKESTIKIIENYEVDVIYKKGENIEGLTKYLLASGYEEAYHIEAEAEEPEAKYSNTFFIKKIVIER